MNMMIGGKPTDQVAVNVGPGAVTAGPWVLPSRGFCTMVTCVKVRRMGDGSVQVGGTELGDEALTYTGEEWDAFTGSVKAGHYDNL